MTISKFARSTFAQQQEMIQTKAIFLDSWNEDGNSVNLYYLNGFFVEVVLSLLHSDPVEILPYKRGYNLKNYQSQLQHRQVLEVAA